MKPPDTTDLEDSAKTTTQTNKTARPKQTATTNQLINNFDLESLSWLGC